MTNCRELRNSFVIYEIGCDEFLFSFITDGRDMKIDSLGKIFYVEIHYVCRGLAVCNIWLQDSDLLWNENETAGNNRLCRLWDNLMKFQSNVVITIMDLKRKFAYNVSLASPRIFFTKIPYRTSSLITKLRYSMLENDLWSLIFFTIFPLDLWYFTGKSL